MRDDKNQKKGDPAPDVISPITVFLPTHNRPAYLRRVLDYYRRYGYPFPLLICDSSREKFSGLDATPQVRYLHYPDEDYLMKLRRALGTVETRYTVIGADDDFVVPRAIRECVSFLESHPGYSSVQGKYVSFAREQGIRFKPSYVDNYAMAVRSDSPADRLLEQFNPYMHQFYAVHRTENLHDALSHTEGWRHNGILIELIVAMMAAINGKHEILPIFFSAKEEIVDSAGSTFAGILDVTSLPRYRGEYEYFLRMVADHLSKRGFMNEKEALDRVAKAMDTYFHVFLPGYLGSPGLYRFKASVKRSLPKTLRHFMLRSCRRIRDILRDSDAAFLSYFKQFDEESKRELEMIREVVGKHDVVARG